MDFEQTLKNITKVLHRNKSHVLPKDIKEKLLKLDEFYNDYNDTKDETYLKKYIQLLIDNNHLPNKKELYLRKISDDKTILDIIAEKAVFLPHDTGTFIASDLDLVKIYLNKKDTSILTYAKQEILMSMYEGTTLLEYLIKNDMLDKYWLDEVQDRKLIDLLFAYNKTEYLKYASEEVLLMDIEYKKTVLEYLIEHNMANEDTIREVEKPIVYDLLVKYNREDLMKYLSNKVLAVTKFGKTILEKVLEKGIKPELTTIYDEVLIKAIIRKKEFDLLKHTCSSLLRKRIPKTKATIFEYLLRRNIESKEAIDAIKYSLSTAPFYLSIIKKCNRLDLLIPFSERELLNEIDGETLLELLIKNDLYPCNISNYSEVESLEILYKYNKFEELQSCDSSLLKTKLPNGKYLYEELLDRNLEINSGYIEDEDILKIIFSKKIINAYYKIPVSSQLKIYKDNITYLEQILIEERTNKTIDLTRLMTMNFDLYQIAKMYEIYARYNKQNYLPILDEDDLFQEKEGKKLIDILLNMNPDLTINKIIPEDVKEEYDVAMILKLRGQNQENIKFESITTKLEREYLTNLRFEYEALTLDNESEELLGELYTIMDDKKSDPYLVYALIASYRNLLSINSKYSYEIRQLIEIKQNNPEFVLKYVKNGAYFNVGQKFIGMEDANIDTLNHEIGHALHHFLTESELPQEYINIMKKLREDKTLLEKTAIYSQRYYELKEIVSEEVEANYMIKYDESIDEEKLKEIQGFLDEEITIKKHKYLKLGYDEQLLDIIFSKVYTVEEYIKQDRRIKKNNMIDLILRTRYSALLCTADYLDGIYSGKFKSGELFDKNNQKIKPGYGHGIGYYRKGLSWAFSEMIANYSEIVKSKNPEEGLKILKEYVGEELVFFIQQYYDKNILQSKKYITETTMTM